MPAEFASALLTHQPFVYAPLRTFTVAAAFELKNSQQHIKSVSLFQMCGGGDAAGGWFLGYYSAED